MVCKKCGKEDAPIFNRGDHLCQDCFHEFLEMKYHRFLTKYSVDYNSSPDAELPLLLVPVSLGIVSMISVHMLAQLMERQRSRNRGRRGFRAICVHVGDGPTEGEWPFDPEDFPLKIIPSPTVSSKLTRSASQDQKLRLLNELIYELAEKLNASAVIWSHSMTRMSELVVAETVKGRGAQIPSFIGAHSSSNIFPLRLASIQELLLYAQGRSLKALEAPALPPPGVRKLQSVDEIVHSYFAEVNQNFPAVVSTVERVASKLAQEPEPCSLCLPGSTTSEVLCYGCRGMLQGQVEPMRASIKDVLAEYEL